MSEFDDTVSEILEEGLGDFELEPVNPVQTSTSNKGIYRYRCRHGKIHIEDIDPPCTYEGRVYRKVGDYVVSTFGGKNPIILGEDTAYKVDYNYKFGAQKQAYFALSILASKGLVSNWNKDGERL